MLLKEHPELRTEIYGIISDEFVRRPELRTFRDDSNRRFDKVDSNFNDLKDWIGIVVGGFQRRAGRNLEDAVAGTLRIALGKDVKPENITRTKNSVKSGIRNGLIH